MNCPTCQLEFDPARSVGRQCPRCLLMGGISAEPSAPMADKWEPPSPAEAALILPAGYEIISLIGRGGMGAVYKARQASLDRLVAIKILPPMMDSLGVSYVERFRNEARLLARLNHPGIVHVYDFGEIEDGGLYFVMEYVEGTDAARLVATAGKLAPALAASITADVCAALHAAHEAGIVHRDIKPANILVSRNGEIKVADFGLAKLPGAANSGLTSAGVFLGTKDFAAPESLTEGMIVDHRADLYAVGVMLYQMLTGALPRGVFRPASSFVQAPAEFDAIIAKAMATAPDDRYQTATAMRTEVQAAGQAAAGNSHPTGNAASASTPRRRWQLVAAVVAILASTTAAWLYFRPTPQVASASPPIAPTTTPPEPFRLLTEAETDAALRTLHLSNPGLPPVNMTSSLDGLPVVKRIDGELCFSVPRGSPIRDISVLARAPFSIIELEDCPIMDLAPLRTTAVINLVFSPPPGFDMTQLGALPLRRLVLRGPHLQTLEGAIRPAMDQLDIGYTSIKDLSSLPANSRLTQLFIKDTPISNLEPLRPLKGLRNLLAANCPVTSVEPLRGLKLQYIHLQGCPITDFTPLLGNDELVELKCSLGIFDAKSLAERLKVK